MNGDFPSSQWAQWAGDCFAALAMTGRRNTYGPHAGYLSDGDDDGSLAIIKEEDAHATPTVVR